RAPATVSAHPSPHHALRIHHHKRFARNDLHPLLPPSPALRPASDSHLRVSYMTSSFPLCPHTLPRESDFQRRPLPRTQSSAFSARPVSRHVSHFPKERTIELISFRRPFPASPRPSCPGRRRFANSPRL